MFKLNDHSCPVREEKLQDCCKLCFVERWQGFSEEQNEAHRDMNKGSV